MIGLLERATRWFTDPRPTDDGDDDPGHLYCCDPDTALCGEDLTDADEDPDEWDGKDDVCPLCALAAEDTCPRCGD